MKKLILMRHGHAKDTSAQGDFGRKLSNKGIAQSQAMAKYLIDEPIDALYVSAAERTQMTADTVTDYASIDAKRIDDDKLYLATTADLFSYITQLPPSCSYVLIIGHNPGLCELAELISDDSGAVIRQRGFSPASIAIINTHCQNWTDVMPACATLQNYHYPVM